MELLEIRNRVKPMMKDKRFLHTLGTEEVCWDLALIHGCDTEKARLTAILHDCAKNIGPEKILSECKRFGLPITEIEKQHVQELLHGKLGAAYAKEKFGVECEDILNAITYHTTGRPDMTLLEKIIFTADFIEPTRKSLPDMEEIRWTAYMNLDLAITKISKCTLSYLERKNTVCDDLTRQTYEYYSAITEHMYI